MNLFIPEGYQRCMPYLILPEAARFSSFMQNLFGATEKMYHLNPDGSLMHGEIRIGDITIMYAQSSEQWGTQAGGFYIHVTDADVVYEKALAEGCTSVMAPSDQPYGRSGGIKDPFGNTWWITTTAAPADN